MALLFGGERTGLSNDDLAQCQRLLTIPCNEAYESLNLAMAVQVVAYELWLASRKPRGGEGTVAAAPHASAQEMERFYEQLAEVLDEIDFRDRTGSGNLMARLRRFFNRAAPDENEIHILRGILTAVQGRRRRAGEPHRARAAPGTCGHDLPRQRRTTPVDPRVVEEMLACMGSGADFANASSVSHEPGRRASARIEAARSAVAVLVGAAPEQIVWTSGATEANNLAIFGAARFHRSKGTHIVTSRTEHPSVLDPCRRLEREGFEVSYLHPGPDGIVEPPQVEAALRPDTILVSLMHVNNRPASSGRAGWVACARARCCCTWTRRRQSSTLDVVGDRIVYCINAHS